MQGFCGWVGGGQTGAVLLRQVLLRQVIAYILFEGVKGVQVGR